MDTVNRNTRPTPYDGGAVKVEIQLILINILDFHEAQQVLTTMMWKSMVWNDSRLSWKTEEHGGVEEIALPSQMVWTPDVVLYNSMDLMKEGDKTYQLTISHDGECHWAPAAVYKSFCSVDMDNFPYDTQRCSLKFGPWAHSEDQVNLTLKETGEAVDLRAYSNSSEWNLLQAIGERNSVLYECCKLPYSDVTFHFVLKRQSSFYTQFLILPIVLMGLCVMNIFWIPPMRPDRTSLGMSLFGVFMLLLLLLVQISPPAKNIKLIRYCCIQIVMIATASALTCLVVNINLKTGPLPSCLTKCTKAAQDEAIEVNNVEVETLKKSKYSRKTSPNHMRINPWSNVATFLDRIFFLIYFVVNIIILYLYLPMPLIHD